MLTRPTSLPSLHCQASGPTGSHRAVVPQPCSRSGHWIPFSVLSGQMRVRLCPRHPKEAVFGSTFSGQMNSSLVLELHRRHSLRDYILSNSRPSPRIEFGPTRTEKLSKPNRREVDARWRTRGSRRSRKVPSRDCHGVCRAV